MNRIVGLFILVLSSFGFLKADGGIEFFEGSWEEALAQAKSQDKLIFMDAYTTWCGPCKWMSKEIFTDEKVGDFYNENFINVKMDMEKGEGIELAKLYEVRAYPTLLFIDGDGNIQHKGLGARDVEKFVSLGTVAADPEARYGTLKQKFEAGNREEELVRNYINVLGSVGEDNAAIMTDYLKTQDSWRSKENTELIFNNSGYELSSYLMQDVVTNREHYAEILGAKKVDDKLESAIAMSLAPDVSLAERKKTYKDYFGDAWQPKFDKSLIYAIMRGRAKMSNYEKARVIDDYIKNYPEDIDSNMLNGLAWGMYESETDKELLKRSIVWVMKSLELDSNYANNDTAAALYYKTGDKYKATAHAAIAIKMAEEDGADASETESLLEKIKAMK